LILASSKVDPGAGEKSIKRRAKEKGAPMVFRSPPFVSCPAPVPGLKSIIFVTSGQSSFFALRFDQKKNNFGGR
jgi:hypothetical protein